MKKMTITDATAQALKLFVTLLYEGKINSEDLSKDENLFPVLNLAEKYDVPSVKAMCAGQMLKKVDASNVLDYIMLADRYNLESLMAFSTQQVWRNASALSETNETKFMEALAIIQTKR